MSPQERGEWTPPYHGVQHYPAAQLFSTKVFSATVHDLGSCATSWVRTPGSGDPIETIHDTAEKARAHAEASLFELTRGAMGTATTGTQP